MNVIIQIFIRIRNLLFFSPQEWKKIAAESRSRKTVYVRFVLPLLCLIAVASIIGTWLAAPREIYSAGYVIYRIVLLWATLSAGLYFSTYLITEIMVNLLGTRNHNCAFALMAYSSCAAYLVIVVVSLFPFFKELLVLSFYSCYLYWKGIPYIIGVEGHKRMIYGLLSLMIVIFSYLLMLFFFGKVLKAIFL